MEPSIIKVIVKSKSPFATLAAISSWVMTILSIHTTTWKRNTFLLAYVIQAKIERNKSKTQKGLGRLGPIKYVII